MKRYEIIYFAHNYLEGVHVAYTIFIADKDSIDAEICQMFPNL